MRCCLIYAAEYIDCCECVLFRELEDPTSCGRFIRKQEVFLKEKWDLTKNGKAIDLHGRFPIKQR